MPDLASPHFHFHHTLHSALEVLARLGISGPRITIRVAGPGFKPDWIVAQEPAAGTPLRPDEVVHLSIAGLGFFHQLPVGMWERSRDGEIGTRELVELFDDPYQKARHWIREGARVFDLHPDNLGACSKWLSLFGLNADDWPAAMWYELALLAPELFRSAGRAEGLRKALKQLLDLDTLEIRLRADWLRLPQAELSLLGARSSELGVDTILGDKLENGQAWDIRVGPVTLAKYDAMQTPQNQSLLHQVVKMCVLMTQRYDISWAVLDPDRPPRLGFMEQNACLGVNSWMGPVAGAMDYADDDGAAWMDERPGGATHVF
jgi:hypothetical protein